MALVLSTDGPPRRPFDTAWHVDVDGIDSDLFQLRTSGILEEATLLLLTGDANMQPQSLGGGPPRRKLRNDRWEQRLGEWSLCSHNPSVVGAVHQDVLLPIRNRIIHGRPGDTHHDNHGGAASIDMVAGSMSLHVQMTIHNSLHCAGERGCGWPNCHEYTLGDHFLAQVDLPDCTIAGVLASASGQLPSCIHEPDRWAWGFHAAAHALQLFCSVVGEFCGLCEPAVSRQDRTAAQWYCDAAAFYPLDY